MDERLRFGTRLLGGERMAALCRESTSPERGYKDFERYKDGEGARHPLSKPVVQRICGAPTTRASSCSSTDATATRHLLSDTLGFFDRETCRVEPPTHPFKTRWLAAG